MVHNAVICISLLSEYNRIFVRLILGTYVVLISIKNFNISEKKQGMKKHNRIKAVSIAIVLLVLLSSTGSLHAQTTTLGELLTDGISNFGNLKAKKSYADAAAERIKQARREYLPNLNLSAQQSYGTVNGMNGPMYGLGGFGVASSGLPLPEQNWNSGFGGLYLANVNWEFFNFGRTQQGVNLARSNADTFRKDLEQEVFQQKVKIAAGYLNLLVSQRLLATQEKDLERTQVFHRNVAARVRTGLLPGVDSTMAAAAVSRAKILLNQIKEQVKVQNNELCKLIGSEPKALVIDTTLVSRIPNNGNSFLAKSNTESHPTRSFLKSRIIQSQQQEKLFKKEYMPSFLLFGIYQTRASGFGNDYATDQTSFTQNYFDGINPTRQNYLFAIGVTWNLTTIARSSKKISSQKLITKGLEEEFETIDIGLRADEDAADTRIALTLQNFDEAPKQVVAAQQAYTQRLTLYNNGLSDLTDVTTAQFMLNRAETDRDIAFTNVWQALLMKAASIGNFDLFTNEL